MNKRPKIGTLVAWHGVLQGMYYLGMITDVKSGALIKGPRVKVQWADNTLDTIGEWYDASNLEIIDE